MRVLTLARTHMCGGCCNISERLNTELMVNGIVIWGNRAVFPFRILKISSTRNGESVKYSKNQLLKRIRETENVHCSLTPGYT
jgi:hypothetical protein